jgi:hypothetical protein
MLSPSHPPLLPSQCDWPHAPSVINTTPTLTPTPLAMRPTKFKPTGMLPFKIALCGPLTIPHAAINSIDLTLNTHLHIIVWWMLACVLESWALSIIHESICRHLQLPLTLNFILIFPVMIFQLQHQNKEMNERDEKVINPIDWHRPRICLHW